MVMMQYKFVFQNHDGEIRKATSEPFPDNGRWIGRGRFKTIANGKPNHYWESSLVNLSTHDYSVVDGLLTSLPKTGKATETSRIPYSNEELEVLVNHPLYLICLAAIHQAAFGKGERHGGNTTPFLEQPWVGLADRHGRGFLSGQCEKKCGEAPSKPPEAFRTEMLGAIVYAGMSLIYEEQLKDRSAK